MPEETRVLYEYHPELAKQMIADAGYPNGFKMKLEMVDTFPQADIAAVLVDQWSKIGVEVELVVLDSATSHDHRFGRNYEDARIDGDGAGENQGQLQQKTWLSQNNGEGWIDKDWIERFEAMEREKDPAKKTAMAKELLL